MPHLDRLPESLRTGRLLIRVARAGDCRLAERAGFEYEGTLRRDRLDLHGRLRNTRVYAIVGPA